MMTLKSIFALVVAGVLCSTVALAAGGPGSGKGGAGAGSGNNAQSSAAGLDTNEIEHLVYMREEEKLARDVYITLGTKFPSLKIFGKIDDAEQRHTCAVCDMLEKYGVADPNTNDNVGMYTGENYGPHFTRKYEELVERGSVSELDALYVGAYMEELDMIDIKYCPEEIIEWVDGIDEDTDCGQIYTENPKIERLYGSLLEGSENHLRAFVRNIERRQGQGSYEAQVLPQQLADNILER
ncbi:MAG: DUF2202 domain-containing protein [Halioglobus sp.]